MEAIIKPFNSPVYPNLEVSLVLVGWSYRDLAKYLKISEDSMSKKMRGLSRFKLEECVKVAELFNKPVEHIFSKTIN